MRYFEKGNRLIATEISVEGAAELTEAEFNTRLSAAKQAANEYAASHPYTEPEEITDAEALSIILGGDAV